MKNYEVHGVYSLSNVAGLHIHLDSDGDAVHWRLAIIDSEKPQKWHKAKIYYNGSGKAYFRHNGARVYLSEVMRI